jgi:hypothetical protein
MNCEHCDNNLKVQSTKYLSGYKTNLHTLFSKKELCADLVNVIISFLVNEKGHLIQYQTKNEDYTYDYWGYRVCSPCFQIGFEKFKSEHDDYCFPFLRRHKYFAMDFDIGKIKKEEYEKESRKYIIYYIVHDYKVDYYRKQKPTQIDWGNGKTLLKIDWE